MLANALLNINNPDKHITYAEMSLMKLSGRCVVCGRKLTNVKSKQKGYGAKCGRNISRNLTGKSTSKNFKEPIVCNYVYKNRVYKLEVKVIHDPQGKYVVTGTILDPDSNVFQPEFVIFRAGSEKEAYEVARESCIFFEGLAARSRLPCQ